MSKQLYCSKNTCDPIECTFRGADLESASLTLGQARRQLHVTCPKNSSLAVCYYSCAFAFCHQVLRCTQIASMKVQEMTKLIEEALKNDAQERYSIKFICVRIKVIHSAMKNLRLG